MMNVTLAAFCKFQSCAIIMIKPNLMICKRISWFRSKIHEQFKANIYFNLYFDFTLCQRCHIIIRYCLTRSCLLGILKYLCKNTYIILGWLLISDLLAFKNSYHQAISWKGKPLMIRRQLDIITYGYTKLYSTQIHWWFLKWLDACYWLTMTS